MIPHNIEAEKIVLGSCMAYPDKTAEILEQLSKDDFHNYGQVLDVFKSLNSKNTPLELMILSNHLSISTVLEFTNDFTPNFEHYIAILKELSYRRKVINFGREMSAKAIEKVEDFEGFRDEVEKKFSAIDMDKPTEMESIYSIASRYFEEMVEGEKDNVIKTYIPSFDSVMMGFRPGDLVIVAARPAMGKTAFMIQLVNNMAINKKRMAAFTIEMTKKQIYTRMISNISGINQMLIRSGKAKDKVDKLLEYNNILINSKVFFDEHINTLQGIKSATRNLKRRQGLDVICIDYLQLMQGKGENRNQEITSITTGLKRLGKELEVPIILLSQLNRANEAQKDKRPLLSHLRESGSIEQDADMVIFLHREDYYEKDTSLHTGEVELIISKHRDGPTGTIKLQFNKNTMSFSDKWLEDAKRMTKE